MQNYYYEIPTNIDSMSYTHFFILRVNSYFKLHFWFRLTSNYCFKIRSYDRFSIRNARTNELETFHTKLIISVSNIIFGVT